MTEKLADNSRNSCGWPGGIIIHYTFQNTIWHDTSETFYVKDYEVLLLVNVTAFNTAVYTEGLDVYIFNSRFINTNITLVGDNIRNTLSMKHSIAARGSTVYMHNMGNITIEESVFKTDRYHTMEKRTYMLNIHDSTEASLSYDSFTTNDWSGNNVGAFQTFSGIFVENVTIVNIESSEFIGLSTANYNGSVMMVIQSEVLLENCQFHSNLALNGPIYGKTSVKIINYNSTYGSNHAQHEGGAYYLEANVRMTNINTKFRYI